MVTFTRCSRKEGDFFKKHPYDFSGITLIKILKSDVPSIEHVDLKSNGIVTILTNLQDKSSLKFEIERERFTASNPHQLLVLMVLLTIILGFLLLMVLRNQIKPIKTLASAAVAFGKGQSLSYKPTGSIEIRKAGSAFLEMRKRLERQIEQRTQMLSGVSHDLRTPLTRLKLALALKEEDSETKEMLNDIQVMQNILDEFLEFSKNHQLKKSLQTIVLQSLKRAEYSTEDVGHFGLQLEQYAHFTSPIRRYPDLMTHRLIKNILNNGNLEIDKELIEEDCKEMSELERIAEKASRQVIQQMICYHMKKYIGHEFNSVVTGITDFGLFAEIDGFYVSGLIHVTDLPGDRYFYDREANLLKGKKTGRTYRLGQNIKIKIANVTPQERKITLIPDHRSSNKK